MPQLVASTNKKSKFWKTQLDARQTEQADNRPSFFTVGAVKHGREEQSDILGDSLMRNHQRKEAATSLVSTGFERLRQPQSFQ